MELELLDRLQQLGVKLDVSSEGDLKIKAPKGIMNEGLVKEITTHKDKFISLITDQQQNISVSNPQIKYPLTSSQKRLWFLNQFDGGDVAYNIPVALDIKGNLEIEILRNSFDEIIKRYDILRTVFDKDDEGEIYQKVIPQSSFEFSINLKDCQSQEGIFTEELIKEELLHAFDLTKAPLLQATIIQRSENFHVFFMNMNHILCDGISINILIRELFEIYGTLVKGEELNLIPLTIQYKDYVLWSLNDQQQAKLIKEEKYWLDKLSGELPVLELAADKIRPAIKTYNGKTLYHSFFKEFKQKLLSFANSNGATLFMVLTAGINGLFSRYTNSADILLGTSVSGREHKDLQNQIGLFLNTIVIRTHLDMDKGFSDLLGNQKKELIDCYSHQNYPFDELVNKLNIKRDSTRSPLFDVLVELHDRKEGGIEFSVKDDNLVISSSPDINRPVSQFDMTFSFLDNTEDLLLSLEFNTDIYNEATVSRLIEHFQNFVLEGIAQPNKSISSINYLSSIETVTLFETFNTTEVPFNQDQTIIDIFESHVQSCPDKVAVKSGNIELTYKEVNERANQLASYLINTYAIGEDDLVVLLMDRSELFLINILGIWKAGGAYIPVETEFPDNRIQDILEVSESKLVISEEKSMRSSVKEKALNMGISLLIDPQVYQEQSGLNINKTIAVKSLSYVIFTSGSTGKPKGAMIEHLGMLNHLFAKVNTLGMDENSIVAQNASQCFDISVWQFFTGLMVGGQTIVYSKKDVLEPASFIKQVKEDAISILEVVPSYLGVLMECEDTGDIDENYYQNIDQLLVTGEALITSVANRWIGMHPNIPLVNAYGPTEASDDITQYVIDKNHDTIIPIGSVLQNLNIYILDDHLNHCGIGIKGELCVSGIGVGRGYLNDPKKTELAFLEDPFRQGVRMYKTGDIARFREDGIIEFFGRKDFQVKIRGYRIELGEIENVLLEQKNLIKKAVVAVKTLDNEKYIIAYIVPNGNLDISAIKHAIQEKLPNYMVPGYFIEIDEIPLSRNGKVDRKALPSISDQEIITSEYVEPRDEVEKTLVNIWKEILGDKEIGITNNFFELGGHSLKAIQLINRIKVVMECDLHVKDVFLSPTIEKLKNHLFQKQHKAIPRATLQDSYPVSPAQSRLWLLSQLEGGSVAYTIPLFFELTGEVQVEKLNQSFKTLISRHEVFRTKFKTDENGDVRQWILPEKDIEFSLQYKNLSKNIEQKEKIKEIVEKEYHNKFDLSSAPLIRALLVSEENKKHLLFISYHHIIGDGTSNELIFKEITSIYNSLVGNTTIPLAELPIQYKDYTVWQADQNYNDQEQFWLNKFSDTVPPIDLPSLQKRPSVKTFNGNTISHQFTTDFVTKLNSYSQKNDVTLYMTLMAGIYGLIYKYSNREDIVLGIPIAGRNHPDLENAIGFYVNSLAIRTKFSGQNGFKELLGLVKEELLDGYSNQNYPIDKLIYKLDIDRDRSRSALFDVMVVLHNQRDDDMNTESSLLNLKVKHFNKKLRDVSQLDMTFYFTPNKEGLLLNIEYNNDVFDSFTINNLLTHFHSFINIAINDEGRAISELEFIDKFEKEQLLETFNSENVNQEVEEDSSRFYVLSENLILQPIGVNGRLYKSIKKSESNPDAIFNPYVNSERIVDTGKLAKRIPTGEIEIHTKEEIEDTIEFKEPQNEVERELLGIWKKLLRSKEPISMNDDFFKVGGNSLKSLLLISKINKAFKSNFIITNVFENPTIEEFAKLLNTDNENLGGQKNKNIFPLNTIKKETKNVFFIPPIIGTSLVFENLAEKMSKHFNCYGNQIKGFLNDDQRVDNVTEISKEYIKNIKSIEDSNHYNIIAYSLGVRHALEIARLLKEEGRNVLLIMIDGNNKSTDEDLNVDEIFDNTYYKNAYKALYNDIDQIEQNKFKDFLNYNWEVSREFTLNNTIENDIYCFQSDNPNSDMDDLERVTTGYFTKKVVSGSNHESIIAEPFSETLAQDIIKILIENGKNRG